MNRQEPNSALAATTWSPALSWPSMEAVTAAMPVAVARAASAPSSKAMRCSNMATVGLPKREYWKPGDSPVNRASACSMLS